MAVGNGNRKEQFEQLDGVIAQWKGVEGGLLPIMQHAQEILGGWRHNERALSCSSVFVT